MAGMELTGMGMTTGIILTPAALESSQTLADAFSSALADPGVDNEDLTAEVVRFGDAVSQSAPPHLTRSVADDLGHVVLGRGIWAGRDEITVLLRRIDDGILRTVAARLVAGGMFSTGAIPGLLGAPDSGRLALMAGPAADAVLPSAAEEESPSPDAGDVVASGASSPTPAEGDVAAGVLNEAAAEGTVFPVAGDGSASALAVTGAAAADDELANLLDGAMGPGGREIGTGVDPENIYELLTLAAVRNPVVGQEETTKKAGENLGAAIGEYLAGRYVPTMIASVNMHFAMVVSGEIGAPLPLRTAVVNFIARSPEHAAAYATKLLSMAVAASQLDGPITIIPPDLEKLKLPDPRVAMQKPDQGRASMARGGIADLRENLRGLRLAYPRAIRALAEANPDTFGNESLSRLDMVAHAALDIQTVPGITERAIFMALMQMRGTLPPGYVTFPKDHQDVGVWMPSDGEMGPMAESWMDPFRAYIGGDEWQADVAEIPSADSRSYPFEARVRVLVGMFSAEKTMTLSNIATVAKRDPLAARRAILRSRMVSLRSNVERLDRAGMAQMDSLELRVQRLLDVERIPEAEALINFASQWTTNVLKRLGRMGRLEKELRLAGEESAAVAFVETGTRLLLNGNIEMLDAFFAEVRKDLRDSERSVRADQVLFTKRVAAALTAVVEAIRVLAVIKDDSERETLAAKVPPVEELLSKGAPVSDEEAREMLRRKGFKGLPGDPAIYALGTKYTYGLLPSGAEDKWGGRLLQSGQPD